MNVQNKIDEFEQKIKQLEKRDVEFQPLDDEIDLSEIFSVIWNARIKIITISLLFSIFSMLYALSLPNKYISESILTPKVDESKNGLGGIAAQYGGLAAMAGINLNNDGNNRFEQALELLYSWPFLEKVITDYNLKPKIFAAKEWDIKAKRYIYDTDVYDFSTNQWLKDNDGLSLEPTSYEAYIKMKNLISSSMDDSSGLLKISYESLSPEDSKRGVLMLINELNIHFKHLDQENAKKSISFLHDKINQTTNTDMRSIFYNLIENHTKTLMLTQINEQYLLEVIIPPMVPEKKSTPKRMLIVIVGGFIGILVSFLFVFVSYLRVNKEK